MDLLKTQKPTSDTVSIQVLLLGLIKKTRLPVSNQKYEVSVSLDLHLYLNFSIIIYSMLYVIYCRSHTNKRVYSNYKTRMIEMICR